MKTSFEQEDIERIAKAVCEMLKPMLSNNGKVESENLIFDKKGLAKYLSCSQGTINKLIAGKKIPHFKLQKGQSGGVRFNKRDIDRWIAKQTIPDYKR